MYEQTCVEIVGRKALSTTEVFKTMNLLSSLHPSFSGVTSLETGNLSLHSRHDTANIFLEKEEQLIC